MEGYIYMAKNQPPVIKTIEELKKGTDIEVGKYNYSGLEKNRGGLDKKRELVLPILNRRSNNTQFLNNGGASNKSFILFKTISDKIEKYKSCIFSSRFTLTSQLLLLVFD